VLLPTASDLRCALSRYAEAVIEDERCPTPGTARVREDRSYTLCVMTASTDVAAAVRAADAVLEQHAARVRPARALPLREVPGSGGGAASPGTRRITPAASEIGEAA
jgi:hypothetical protein